MAAPRRRRRRYDWGFRSAALAILGLALWTELVFFLATGARRSLGGEKWGYALGFFFAVLPLLAVLVYRFGLIFDFFRSVKVGVVNLIFIGLGAILGVLFHQEDPNRPIPEGAIESLVEWQESGSSQPWTREQRMAWANYLDFRTAQAFFGYHFLRSLPWIPDALGVPNRLAAARESIEEKMVTLRQRLPELEARFGEEFRVALETGSERGLETREENADVAELETLWNDFWWSLYVWADRLDLIRVYKSDWFAVLWAILFFGVLSNTFRGGWRRLLRPSKWGFAIVHGGVLLVLLGAWHGRLVEARGIVQMHIGEMKSEFLRYDLQTQRFQPLGLFGVPTGRPFHVKLDAFRADHHDVLDVTYLTVDENGRFAPEFALDRPHRSRVYEGQVLHFDWGPFQRPAEWAGLTEERILEEYLRPAGIEEVPEEGDIVPHLTVRVLEYIPQARLEEYVRPASAEEAGAQVGLIQFGFYDGDGQEPEESAIRFGVDMEREAFDDPVFHAHSGTRIQHLVSPDEDFARKRLERPVQETYGTLFVATPARPRGQPFEVLPGEVYRVAEEDREFEIRVLRVTPTLILQRSPGGDLEGVPAEGPVETTPAVNPAVEVEVRDLATGEMERRWVLQNEFQPPDTRFPELEIGFRWDEWRAPCRLRLTTFMLNDGTVLLGRNGEPDSLRTLRPEERYPLDANHSLAVLSAAFRGKVEQRAEPVEEADFFHSAPAAVRVEVRSPTRRQVTLLSAERRDLGDTLFAYTGPEQERRIVWLSFHEDMEDMPLEWRSRLSFYEIPEGGAHPVPVDTGEIRVNDYYTFKGFRFFQTDARPQDPTYSGVGVVYDPGIPMVLAGLYMVLGGSFLVFIFFPLILRRRRQA